MNNKLKLILFILFCFWGPLLEFILGNFFAALGAPCWIYPASGFTYTSWKVIPLWGITGLQGAAFYKVIKKRDITGLVEIGLLTILAFIWVAVIEGIINNIF